MKMKCLMEVEFQDSKTRDAAKKAISHEGRAGNRSRSMVKEKQKSLFIEIDADDVVALRATANSYLRALQVFDDIQ